MHFPSAPASQSAALRSLLEIPRRCAIVTHYNPDGDAIGSSLGLAHVLRAAGHTVDVVLPNAPPSFLHWLPGVDACIGFHDKGAKAVQTIQRCEVLFCLDFNRPDRVGGLEESVRTATLKVLIDHHQEPDTFSDITFSDTSASSTCQMVVDVLRSIGLDAAIGTDAATCFYTGLVTDSGSFRFSSTSPHTMRVAADMMERGVVITRVHESILDDNSESRLKLLGFTLNERMEVLHDLGVAIITLGSADLKRFDFQPGDTEGFVNYGLSIRGIRLAAFFMERTDMVKVSLRSKGTLPVDRLVKDHFNGGGHRNAAGGQTQEALAAAVARFKALLPTFMSAYPQ